MHHSDFTSFATVGERFHTAITATYPLNGGTGKRRTRAISRCAESSWLSSNFCSDSDRRGTSRHIPGLCTQRLHWSGGLGLAEPTSSRGVQGAAVKGPRGAFVAKCAPRAFH